jgi:hypothetical protein
MTMFLLQQESPRAVKATEFSPRVVMVEIYQDIPMAVRDTFSRILEAT